MGIGGTGWWEWMGMDGNGLEWKGGGGWLVGWLVVYLLIDQNDVLVPFPVVAAA